MNKILVYCGIADINPDHDEGKKESLKIRFIPNQSYGIISMEDNFIVAEQSKYTDQSKGVCAKGVVGARPANTIRGPRVVCRSSLWGRTRGVASWALPC